MILVRHPTIRIIHAAGRYLHRSAVFQPPDLGLPAFDHTWQHHTSCPENNSHGSRCSTIANFPIRLYGDDKILLDACHISNNSEGSSDLWCEDTMGLMLSKKLGTDVERGACLTISSQ
jgi:hypothetical protein